MLSFSPIRSFPRRHHSQVLATGDSAGNTADHAFRYDRRPGAGGVMRDLGMLGGMCSGGSAINNVEDILRCEQLNEEKQPVLLHAPRVISTKEFLMASRPRVRAVSHRRPRSSHERHRPR